VLLEFFSSSRVYFLLLQLSRIKVILPERWRENLRFATAILLPPLYVSRRRSTNQFVRVPNLYLLPDCSLIGTTLWRKQLYCYTCWRTGEWKVWSLFLLTFYDRTNFISCLPPLYCDQFVPFRSLHPTSYLTIWRNCLLMQIYLQKPSWILHHFLSFSLPTFLSSPMARSFYWGIINSLQNTKLTFIGACEILSIFDC